ncbi:MAG: precorrin-2 C(20)-methyltransferase [Proteobacteria bacterium]|nr:precorrin-2 C(20)-methyltransferase [Pseudomonadota bacterium]
MKPGTLYGIGVGPGDPELITIKAVRALERVDVVYAAASTKNDYSVALDIARPYLSKHPRIETLGFPMTRDEAVLEKAWRENAQAVAATLAQGNHAAFLTLGDPLLYSTFGYLLRTLKERHPEVVCQIIPGITSFQAAAARTQTILAESGENIVVTSGVGRNETLKTILQKVDNAVILKTYRDFDRICDTLEELDLARGAVLVSRCGQEGERIEHDVMGLRGEKMPYLSLLIVKRSGSR